MKQTSQINFRKTNQFNLINQLCNCIEVDNIIFNTKALKTKFISIIKNYFRLYTIKFFAILDLLCDHDSFSFPLSRFADSLFSSLKNSTHSVLSVLPYCFLHSKTTHTHNYTHTHTHTHTRLHTHTHTHTHTHLHTYTPTHTHTRTRTRTRTRTHTEFSLNISLNHCKWQCL